MKGGGGEEGEGRGVCSVVWCRGWLLFAVCLSKEERIPEMRRLRRALVSSVCTYGVSK